TSIGAIVYRIDPEIVPFDITPFSGDIFSRHGIPNGHYHFDVVATDSSGQEARANVRISVGTGMGRKYRFKDKVKDSERNQESTSDRHFLRNKRNLGHDILLTLKENHSLGLLKTKINLDSNENIMLAPITTDYLRIHNNGSIELIKQLNYELEMSHQAAVQISGPLKGMLNYFISE
ncbi:unnamed protein product, partial [Thelazia callipaeda]|uniref:CA domain-containing protein n=1 Tax=Thelazia callipaeda TaxID=103827 RepID=A0A0N5D8Y3_THECL